MNEIISQSNLTCKYCQSAHVIKFGTYKAKQRYFCKDCNRKFVSSNTIPKMQNTTKDVADVLNMYYEGMSENEIRRNLIQQDTNYVSTGSVYNWVKRFTKLAQSEADKQTPKVGDTWIADETVFSIDKKNIWLIDIIDADTRFLLATKLSLNRNKRDIQTAMERASAKSGKRPKVVMTDGWGGYRDGIELAFGADSKHIVTTPFVESANSTNLVERWHSTLKERTKVMRCLKTMETAREFLDGWLIHYNYFRPHMSLQDRTPAQEAGIEFPFRNWKDVVEQPYEITARIPLSPRAPRLSPKIRHKKRVRISHRTPRIMPQMGRLR